MPFQLGTLKSQIAGGPYSLKPHGYVGVKMAAESHLPCEINVPTVDFEVPEVAMFKRGLMKGIMAIASGSQIYVGCMGGIGRTGLYMAGMAKVMSEYRKKLHRPQFDPVLYVRGEYLPHAVETSEQKQFIADLNVDSIVDWWHTTQRELMFCSVPQDVLIHDPSRGHSLKYPDERITEAWRKWFASRTQDYEILYPAPTVNDPSRDHFMTFVGRKEEAEKRWWIKKQKDDEILGLGDCEPAARPYAHCGQLTPIYDDHEEIPPDFDPEFWEDRNAYKIRQAQGGGRVHPMLRQALNRIEALETAVNKKWWKFWQ